MRQLKAIKVFLDTSPSQLVSAMEQARAANVPVVIVNHYNVQLDGEPIPCFTGGREQVLTGVNDDNR